MKQSTKFQRYLIVKFCIFKKNKKYLKFRPSILLLIFVLSLSPVISNCQSKPETIHLDFCGDTIELVLDPLLAIPFNAPLSDSSIRLFYNTISSANYQPLINSLLTYREQKQLDDWLFYQLIRGTAQYISPKAENYQRYTLYKWFLLIKAGYASTIRIRNEKILLYVQSNDEVFNIPCITVEGKQYVCLNYHDYAEMDFEKEKFTCLTIEIPEAKKSFSYKVNKLPDFKPERYAVKELQFDFYQSEFHFNVMLNNEVKKIFTNYPVVDYETYFNIPLSKLTYNSLIPVLRKNIKNMHQKDGIDYLMRFTRYAFAYETDTKNFGSEKRLSPEQTLLYNNSDCEDRAALFFYLVKELYNLPMIVLSYPEHITIAVEFDKPLNNPIIYKGNNYWVCEPTPQKKDLRIGQSIPSLRNVPYNVVYAYKPTVMVSK